MRSKRYRAAHPGYRHAERERMAGYRVKALDMLGRECLRCGYDEDERALAFDHIADDGVDHRAVVGTNIAQWAALHSSEAVQRLQVLCANCNAIKRVVDLTRHVVLGIAHGRPLAA
jgi:hypothetical protein